MSSRGSLTARLTLLRQRFDGGVSSSRLARLRMWISIFFSFGVLILLISKLHSIGFDTIRHDLPKSAMFYILMVFTYCLQPLGEFLIYVYLWNLKGLNAFAVFLRKRVFDAAVMSYSGETILYLWAQRATTHTHRRLLSNIKDNVILSAVTSNTATVVMVLIFLSTGQMQRLFDLAPNVEIYVALVGSFAGVLGILVVRFRASILTLSGKALVVVLGIHSARLFLILGLQAWLWAIALPGVPYQTWMVLLTLQLVLTRIPFLPNQDLMFLTLVVSVAGFVEAGSSSVAATFTMIGALIQLLHVISFGATSLKWRS